MSNPISFPQDLHAIWQHAVAKYESGVRGSGTYFDDEQLAFLRSIGHSAQEVYDFAEDYTKSGEPTFETFLLIAAQRRWYFINAMKGQAGTRIVDTGDLPPKTDSVRGIEWLPRLIEKARAKLRGEMSDDLMFCCGGDRAFFRTHQIHPADLLQFVAMNFANDEAVIDWVVTHSQAN